MALSDWILKSPNAATPATPATHRPGSGAEQVKTRSSVATVASVATLPVSNPDSDAPDFTAEELAEMDTLIRELAELESWKMGELAHVLDERKRMAAVNVRKALARLRASARVARASWPEPPGKRSKVVLCLLTGGKS